MADGIISRTAVRTALCNILKAAVTRVPSERILLGREDPKGKSPWLMVLSGGSFRPGLTSMGRGTAFAIDIVTLVLQSDPNVPSWTPAAAEELLDSIEVEVASAIIAMPSYPELFQSIRIPSPSSVERHTLNGFVYITEVLTVEPVKDMIR